MRKGLKITLFSVVVALLGMQRVAFGMAPVIEEIPNIIVGDVEDATYANNFVYPDAFNLSDFVSDDTTADANIIWGYTVPNLASQRYMLNGVQPLSSSEVAAAATNGSIPTAKQIQNQVLQNEQNLDNNAQTVTIRDIMLSPLPPYGGTNSAPTGVATETVTLFASDGEIVSQRNVLINSEAQKRDGMATASNFTVGSGDSLQTVNFTSSGTSGFTPGTVVGGSTVVVDPNGISITTNSDPATGNIGEWQSADNFINVVAGYVWRVRAEVSSSNLNQNENPMWDVIVNNYNSGLGGPYSYGYDAFFYDNVGGANSAGTRYTPNWEPGNPGGVPQFVGRTSFEAWFTPAAMTAAHFTADLANAQFDNQRNCNVIFRVLDVGDFGAAGDVGTVTMTSLSVDRFALNRVATVGTSLLNASSMIRTGDTNGIWTAYAAQNATTFDWTGGVLTVSPTNTSIGWGLEDVELLTGDNTFTYNADGSLSNSADDFLINWDSNKLYRMEVVMSADSANGQKNPPDLITIGLDNPGNEYLPLSYVTPGLALDPGQATQWNIAMPKAVAKDGTTPVAPQTFTAFFYTHTASFRGSNVGAESWARMRPRIQVLCDPAKVLGAVFVNSGGIKFHSVKVDEVTIN